MTLPQPSDCVAATINRSEGGCVIRTCTLVLSAQVYCHKLIQDFVWMQAMLHCLLAAIAATDHALASSNKA